MSMKKSMLAVAITVLSASASASAFALEEIKDESLSLVTAQDGVGIHVNTTGVNIGAMALHDTDGIPSFGYSFDGALVLSASSLVTPTNNNPFTVAINTGSNSLTAGNSTLLAEVRLPPLTLTLGAMSLANSQRDDGGWGWTAQSANFLSAIQISIADYFGFNLNLGSEVINGSVAGSDMINFSLNTGTPLAVGGVSLYDVSNGASAGFASANIFNTGGAGGFSLNADINLTGSGVEIGLGSLGGSSGMTVAITGVNINGAGVGNFSISGLQFGGPTTVVVNRH